MASQRPLSVSPWDDYTIVVRGGVARRVAACLTPGAVEWRNTRISCLSPKMFRRIRSDFVAHGRRFGAQGFWAMLVYRFGRWCQQRSNPAVRRLLSFPYHVGFKLVQVTTGIHLPREVRVGRNFIIDHHGGIVVSGLARFGHNCRIRNGVVIGHATTGEPSAPQIGNCVDIGAGAKLLGRIRVGNNVAVGANAVVLCDVPDNSIAVGVPAVVKPRRSRKMAQGVL